jgi:hypothetical protein
MKNSSKKSPTRQPRQRRCDLIDAAKLECKNEIAEIAKERIKVGYPDLTWDDFLEVSPDDILDIEKRSRVIDLQQRYKDLRAREEILYAEDKVVDELNKIHAVVHIDQTYIITEKDNTLGGKDFSLESRQSFKAYYEDETIVCSDGIERSKADVWLKSQNRRKYKGIIFDPTSTASPKYYNLWKGFTKMPIQGNCQKYWDHVRENICNDDQEAYNYLRKWLAYIFQRPHEVHTALVLCGSQGVGKNSFVEPLGVLLGSHYAPLSSITELVSNFNYHLKNAVLIHANEALWGGNKKEIGTVKAMVTEQTCLIEGKGKDRIVVRNFKHIILSSNEDWPIHLDADDRRFFVLQVSEKHKEDHAYFKAVQEELNDGGYEALLHDLLHEDLTGFNPRKLPSSSNSFSIKMRSADSPHRYLYEVLNQGGFTIGKTIEGDLPVWQGQISKETVYEDYVAWCQNSGEATLSKEQFGKVIKKFIPSVEEIRPGGTRKRCHKFPSLRQARNDFSKAYKEEPQRIFDDYDDGSVQASVHKNI